MCPVIVCLNRAPGNDQILSVLSSEPESKSRPSFENETVRTVPECALRTVDFPSTLGDHRRMVRSLDPDAMQFALGEYATEYTAACTQKHSIGEEWCSCK